MSRAVGYANGIVHVSAEDRATGKEQSITVTGQSSLSREDIDRMVRDAEAHAEEDRRRREEAEARNEADTQLYVSEKLLEEHGDVTGPERDQLEAAVSEVRGLLQQGDVTALRAATERLSSAGTAFGARLQGQPGPGHGAATSSVDDDVIDAEVVDEGSRA